MIQFGNGVIEAEFQVPTAPFGGVCQPSWRPATVLVSCWARSTVTSPPGAPSRASQAVSVGLRPRPQPADFGDSASFKVFPQHLLSRLFYRYQDLAPQLVPLDYTNSPDVKVPYELISTMPELKVQLWGGCCVAVRPSPGV